MALVQTSGKIRTSGSGDVNVTMPSNFTAGNSAIASGCRYEGAITSLTINGTTATVTTQSNSALSGVWIRHVASLTGGSNSATLDTPGGSDYNTFSIEEHSGLDTASLVDTTATPATGSSTSPSITVNPSAVGNLIYGAWDSETGSSNLSISSPASYTAAWLENDANTYQGGSGAYRTAAASGSQSTTWTTGTSINWRAVGAVFKAASGGGGDVSASATGVSSTAAVGSVSPGISKALTGNGASAAVGTVTPATAKALTGNAVTASVGAVGASVTVALTGVQAGAQAGSVSAGSDVTVALTGVAVAVAAGDVDTSRTIPLTGAVATTALGAVAADTAKAISGVSASALVGSVTVVGDVTVAITGVQAVAQVGDVSVDAPARTRGGGSPRRGYIYKGQRYYLTPEELAVLIAQDVIAPAEVKQVSRKQKAKAVDPGTWAEVEAVLKRLEKLTEPEDDDEEEEALLLLI